VAVVQFLAKTGAASAFLASSAVANAADAADAACVVLLAWPAATTWSSLAQPLDPTSRLAAAEHKRPSEEERP
jgi:hypothetical protein